MKKIVVILAALLAVIGCFGVAACDGGSSTAVTEYDHIREDFAANKEKEDDEKGREHIEIPADAEKITIKNGETNEDEEWTVVRNIEDFSKIFTNEDTLSKNYIMANDIEFKGWTIASVLNKVFVGNFNGNNFKFCDSANLGRTCLFDIVKESVIENIVFSSKGGEFKGTSWYAGYVLIAATVQNSTIKNCVNYSQSQIRYCGGFIYGAEDSVIENCINYGDFSKSHSGIVHQIENCTIKNCINYGNLSHRYDFLGGIVGRATYDNTIENCENYGKISGKSNLGGIVGGVWRGLGYSYIPDTIYGLNDKYYTENQIIKNCKNYGDIYLLKEEKDKRCETTGHEQEMDNLNVFEFGGIAGSISKVENCINEGSFYGFENLGNEIKVDYLGGVVGAVKQDINCENRGIINVQKGRALHVGDIYGSSDRFWNDYWNKK